jgi:protein involved in polysaccharide export with SLBB domain
VVPDLINTANKFDYSVESIPGENMFYPTATPEVFVMGQVGAAGAFSYKSHLRVKDYIAYANPTVTAKMNVATLIRNGKKKKVGFDVKPHPGDIIMVRSKPSFAVIVSTVSTALSLALTAVLIENTVKN